MIKVASYCRVSTDRDDQVNSFETQQQFFREYIERRSGWELYEVYADDGITGTNTKKRIQFNRMIKDAYEGKFQLIITKEVSRFSRNILDTIMYTRELKSIGVAVLFLMDSIHTMDPDAELRLSIMASIAQEESRRTSGRVIWGQTRQMEKGVVFGPSLLGYDVRNGKITVNPEGAEIVKLIFHKYAVEQVGTTDIARFLTSKHYSTCRGNTKWTSNTVIKILNNEKYVGDLVQKKTYTLDFLSHEKRKNKGEVPLICIENHHESIICREIWNLTQKRLQKNDKHRVGDSGHSNRYGFSGKIKCGECGANFVGRHKYLKDGTKLRRWSCYTVVKEGSDACNIGRLVRDDDAKHMLKTAMQSLQIDPNPIIHNVTSLALNAIQSDEQDTDTPERLRYEILRTEKKKEDMLDCYFSGNITQTDMQVMKRRYELRLEELRERLSSAVGRKAANQDAEVLRATIQANVIALFQFETESEILCKSLLDKITVFKDHHLELQLSHLPQIFRFTG